MRVVSRYGQVGQEVKRAKDTLLADYAFWYSLVASSESSRSREASKRPWRMSSERKATGKRNFDLRQRKRFLSFTSTASHPPPNRCCLI